MNTTQAQQKALDDALVALMDHLEFGKSNVPLLFTCNEFGLQSRFIVIPQGQVFEDLPLEHDILSFIKDLGNTGDITYLTDIENKDAKKTNKTSYPRFTKIIIDYIMSKDQSISRRNKMFWHTTQDDTMFTSMRCIFRYEDTQVYGTILPRELTNQAMLESKAYQTYYVFASREKALKRKYIRKKSDSDTSPKKKHAQATKGTRLKSKAKVAKPDKKKQPIKKIKAKGLAVLSKVALTEAEQIKLATKRSKKDFHVSHESGSGDGVDTQSKVPNEQQQESDFLGDSEDEDNNDDDGDNDEDGESDDHDDDSDDERIESDSDEIPDPNLTNVDQTEYEEEDVDDRVRTPSDYELTERLKADNTSLFDVGSRRISIITVNTKEYHSDVLERITKKRTKNKAKTTKPDSEWKRL
ncbi:hypothetical protein Tco_0897053 [Tanacetum coccineum]